MKTLSQFLQSITEDVELAQLHPRDRSSPKIDNDTAIDHLYHAVKFHSAAAQAKNAGNPEAYHRNMREHYAHMYLHMKHSPLHQGLESRTISRKYLDSALGHSTAIHTGQF